MVVGCDTVRYSRYQHIGGMYCVHLQGRKLTLKTETAHSFETFVPTYQTTQCSMPEVTGLQDHYCEKNLKSHVVMNNHVPQRREIS